MNPWRFEVSTRPELPDPPGDQVRHVLEDFRVGPVQSVRTTRLYTIWFGENAGDDRSVMDRIARELLTDPVCETCRVYAFGETIATPQDALVVEVHLKPGVMDNVADSTSLALADMGIRAAGVSTGRRYEIRPALGRDVIPRLPRLLGNECVEEVVLGTKPLGPQPTPPSYQFELRRVPLLSLDESGLERLSRQGHLFLSVQEMRTIQAHYRTIRRDPTDLELETLAQTWSEHCVHKTLRSAVEYRGEPFPLSSSRSLRPCAWDGPGYMPPRRKDEGFIATYSNLLKDTIARATEELISERRGPECLSVFKDNAGIIVFDDRYAAAFKVETHNHPSAIEPYGGSATGIGGVIRDILGCGLGAKPIANTDVFCVAPPDWPIEAIPKGVIHPKSVLKGIVSGVRDYGNRMGIPTVNGAIHFDPRYLGNVLVYCGCIGLIPRDRIEKAAKAGDAIILLGGRTGRDGIHGATFSSAELTDKHEDEFAHAVQIGNPIEEKKILDVILQARDFYRAPQGGIPHAGAVPGEKTDRLCLYSAITDCGAGGLSSAVGEMAAEIGAEVDLDKVPLKYAGLRYDEIWISEAQERMVLAVPLENIVDLLALAKSEDVEATIIGRFTGTGRLVVRYQGTEVGDLDLRFLHDGVPKIQRRAEWWPVKVVAVALPSAARRAAANASPARELRERLAVPDTASKHWVIRQYDHEVQAGSVIKPLAGCRHGPSDAAVLRPRLDSKRGLAIGCGLAPRTADADPYWMAVAAIDEALRNVVSVGGDPAKTAILDNFCWPRADDARNLGALVRACQACYDVAKAYGLPFISGKDSLNNEFALDPADVEMVRRHIERATGVAPMLPGGRLAIPYTLLISAIALIEDAGRCVSMDLKQKESRIYLIGQPTTFDGDGDARRPLLDLDLAAETHRTAARMIRDGLVVSVHDVSEGGPLVACAEMCLAADRSCRVHGSADWSRKADEGGHSPGRAGDAAEDEFAYYFGESAALYLVEAANARYEDFARLAGAVPSALLATASLTPEGSEATFEIETRSGLDRIPLRELRSAWQGTLDW